MGDCGLHAGEKAALCLCMGINSVDKSVETVESHARAVYTDKRYMHSRKCGFCLYMWKNGGGGPRLKANIDRINMHKLK